MRKTESKRGGQKWFLKIPNVVFGETSGNNIPVDYGPQAQKYLMTHNFVNCIKHETKFNFLFME